MPGAVTIATNMAGAGPTSNWAVMPSSGLPRRPPASRTERPALRKVAKIEAEVEAGRQKALGRWRSLGNFASERHESRRIDNQLRGRSGRQGDPGRSSFYLSLQDDLMRIFGSGPH